MFKRSFTTAITDVWDGADTDPRGDQPGDLRQVGNKFYKCVKMKAVPTAEVDAASGDAACYTDYSAHEVGVDITDIEGKLPAGVFLATIDTSAVKGYYCWVQIKGPATLNQTPGNSAAEGDQLALTGTGAADKTFTKATTILPKAGVMISATEAMLDCPW